MKNFLIPISSRQQDLYSDLGMERTAHILITLSYVQRILHRFQSALSDGYEEEAPSLSLRLSKDTWNSNPQSLYFSVRWNKTYVGQIK